MSIALESGRGRGLGGGRRPSLRPRRPLRLRGLPAGVGWARRLVLGGAGQRQPRRGGAVGVGRRGGRGRRRRGAELVQGLALRPSTPWTRSRRPCPSGERPFRHGEWILIGLVGFLARSFGRFGAMWLQAAVLDPGRARCSWEILEISLRWLD
jgi:hypothetical protein